MKGSVHFLTYTFVLAASLLLLQAQAQGRMHIVQFSGLVLGGEDGQPIPGATLYIPKAGRGAVTNPYGSFSMPTLPGDSVVVSAVGYKKRFYRIPNTSDDGLSVVIELKTDTTTLPIVEVYPYPTEELFKKALLALELPEEAQQEQFARNFNPAALARMTASMGASPAMNYRNTVNQQLNYQTNRYFNPMWTFMDPFRWAQFIKSLKKSKPKPKK